ncbi:hypothetical protein LJC00_03645 [Dysgonomonas sp. OttesenSCG-928-M03]|nr:hypothetical protein [Dysgonomonas sp. OttesenSCG-928-M03]
MISRSPADFEKINRALELCKELGHLTQHELMQLHEAGLPFRIVLENILRLSDNARIDSLIGLRQITYSDVMCIIGILAQDCRIQEQKKGIHL